MFWFILLTLCEILCWFQKCHRNWHAMMLYVRLLQKTKMASRKLEFCKNLPKNSALSISNVIIVIDLVHRLFLLIILCMLSIFRIHIKIKMAAMAPFYSYFDPKLWLQWLEGGHAWTFLVQKAYLKQIFVLITNMKSVFAYDEF